MTAKKTKPPLWIEIIEAGLNDLMRLHLEVKDELHLPAWVKAYLKVLIAYLQGDVQELTRLIEGLTPERPPNAPSFLIPLCQLRQRIRETKKDPTLVQTLLSQMGRGLELPEWQGEIYFVLALYFETQGDQKESKHYYEKAAQNLQKIKANKKAAKALFNALACESRIHPHRKLFTEYHYVYKQAKKARDFSVAGQSLMNLSREYQILGARVAALKYANKAMALLRNEMDSLSYYLGLVHRCHLLVEMKRDHEAQLDYELAMSASFPQVKAALQVVDALRADAQPKTASAPPHATPTWAERAQVNAAEDLGEIENALITALSQGPKTKFELIQYLYGERLDPLAAENRLKAVLFRLRKKHKGLVVFEQGKYFIPDPEADPADSKGK